MVEFDQTMVIVPLTPLGAQVLQAAGQGRHIRTNGKGELALPITKKLFDACCKQQHKGETIEDVLIRALRAGGIH